MSRSQSRVPQRQPSLIRGALNALVRLSVWMLVVLGACAQHDSPEAAPGISSQAVGRAPGYPFTFRWVSITTGPTDTSLHTVSFDLSGAIYATGSESYECNAPNQRPCSGQLVRIPEDMDFGILEIESPNSVHQGTIAPDLAPFDMRMTVRGPGDPIIDFHVDPSTGTVTTHAAGGDTYELTDSCVRTSSGWKYCWTFDLPCKAGEANVSCTAEDAQCPDALSRGSATCTNANPEPCSNLSCGFDWDLVSADPATQPAATDLNGIKLNPRWGWQTRDVAEAQKYNGDTSQPTEVDAPSPDLFGAIIPWSCGSGILAQDATGHHVNWDVVTYHGQLFWSGWDSPDDDYNFHISSPMTHGFPSGITGDNGTIFDSDPARKQRSLKLEFKMGEVMGRFGNDSNSDQYWIDFDNDIPGAFPGVERGTDADPQHINGTDGVSGTEAITIGLMGLDTQHDAVAEVHPVWALAIRTDASPGHDVWHIFARNYGNEGWCSHQQHYLTSANGQPFDLTMQLPRPAGATRTAPILVTSKFAGNTKLTGPTISTPDNDDAFITFHLPSPAVNHELGQFSFGSLVLDWTSAAPPPPPPLASAAPPPPPAGPAAPQTAGAASATEEEDEAGEPEREVESLMGGLSNEQRAVFLSVLPRLRQAPEPATVVATPITLATTRPARSSVVLKPVAVDDPSQVQHHFDIARALCAALNGQIDADAGTCHDLPPTTKLTTSGGALGDNGWMVTPLTITLGSIDSSGTGIDHAEYSFDGASFTDYSGPFVAPEGHTTIYYRSEDNHGNLEELNQRSFDIDTRKPSSVASVGNIGSQVSLSFEVTDPTPGSGAAGLFSISQQGNPSQLVTQFTPLQQGTVLLATQCTNIEYWAKDNAGNQESPHQRLLDLVPPTLTVAPTTLCMSPPNHKRLRFRLGSDFTATATDACDAAPSVKVVSVTSNEPDNGLGDGDTAGDVGFGPSAFCVRRERSGAGSGRVYTVVVEAKDSSGNTARQELKVSVPHSGNPKGCSGGTEIPDDAACQ